MDFSKSNCYLKKCCIEEKEYNYEIASELHSFSSNFLTPKSLQKGVAG